MRIRSLRLLRYTYIHGGLTYAKVKRKVNILGNACPVIIMLRASPVVNAFLGRAEIRARNRIYNFARRSAPRPCARTRSRPDDTLAQPGSVTTIDCPIEGRFDITN